MAEVTSVEVVLTQQTIDDWAALTGDFNPLHVDPEYSAGSLFGGTVAHGHLALALMEGMMHGLVGEDWLDGGVLDVKFTAPVRSGERFELFAHDADGVWTIQLREHATGKVCAAGTAHRPATGTTAQ